MATTIDRRFGSVKYHAHAIVNHAIYLGDPDDVRTHTIELTIDLDKILDRLVARACRSKGGRAQTVHGAIRVRRVNTR